MTRPFTPEQARTLTRRLVTGGVIAFIALALLGLLFTGAQ